MCQEGESLECEWSLPLLSFLNFLQENYVIFGTKKETNSGGRVFFWGVVVLLWLTETRSYKTFKLKFPMKKRPVLSGLFVIGEDQLSLGFYCGQGPVPHMCWPPSWPSGPLAKQEAPEALLSVAKDTRRWDCDRNNSVGTTQNKLLPDVF